MNENTLTRPAPHDAGAETRGRLIQAAGPIFAQNGFDGASVRMITSEADTNLGAITYHFGSKRALYEAVLDHGLRPLLERVRAAARGPGPALDRLVSLVEEYFDHLATHPGLPHLLLQEVAAGREPPAVVREIVGEVKQTVAGLHREGVADGSVRDGDSVLMALSVVSQPVYLNLIAPMLRSVADIDLGDAEVRRHAVSHVSDFVRRGLERPTETTP